MGFGLGFCLFLGNLDVLIYSVLKAIPLNFYTFRVKRRNRTSRFVFLPERGNENTSYLIENRTYIRR